MNFDELLEYLDIEEASQLSYFEMMADLLECEEYIESEAIYKLMEGCNHETVAGITEEYFDDLLEGLPDAAGEIYTLLHQIKLSLVGMMGNIGDIDDIRKLSDEVYNVRTWLCEDSEVELRSESTGAIIYQNLRDAITTSRIEKMGGESYRYDFENALNYQLDSYAFSFAELLAAEDTQVQ